MPARRSTTVGYGTYQHIHIPSSWYREHLSQISLNLTAWRARWSYLSPWCRPRRQPCSRVALDRTAFDKIEHGYLVLNLFGQSETKTKCDLKPLLRAVIVFEEPIHLRLCPFVSFGHHGRPFISNLVYRLNTFSQVMPARKLTSLSWRLLSLRMHFFYFCLCRQQRAKCFKGENSLARAIGAWVSLHIFLVTPCEWPDNVFEKSSWWIGRLWSLGVFKPCLRRPRPRRGVDIQGRLGHSLLLSCRCNPGILGAPESVRFTHES